MASNAVYNSSEILFFDPRSTYKDYWPGCREAQCGVAVRSSRRLGTRHKHDKVYWAQAKSQFGTNSKCRVLLYLAITLRHVQVFLIYFLFSFNKLVTYFISEWVFPTTREIGNLVMRPWEMTETRKTHGRAVIVVGKSAIRQLQKEA